MWNSKPKKKGHDCRRRMAGNPKVGFGLCWWRKYRPAVEERIKGKRLAKHWLDTWYDEFEDLYDVEV